MENRARRVITTSILEEDYQYCKKMGLKISNMIKESVERHSNTVRPDDIASLKARIGRMSDYLRRAMEFIDQEKLSDKFLEQSSVNPEG